MTKLELKRCGSSDQDLESWRPTRDEDVFFVLDMEIGESGKDGADLFYVAIATPAGLQWHKGDVDTTSKGAIVLQDYSLSNVVAHVRKIISECSAATWQASVEQLTKHFDYEYEDYRP